MIARDTVSDAWRDVAQRHGCDTGLAEQVLDDLVHAYTEPHRYYHNLDHIADLLGLLEELGGAADGDAVKSAILFHDAVYDPARQDNETASANLAVERLMALGLPKQRIAKVERYILATQHGAPLQARSHSDLDLLLDLDLSVLAAPPDRYRAYTQAIRQEYAAVSEELYRPGRRRVLEGFLTRLHIYRLERLRLLWEVPARVNLAGEIAALT